VIYKEDFVLLYTNSNDVFTTLLKLFPLKIMKVIKCLIVDDEPPAIRLIENI
jgi:uncharacterized protein YlbG (UPF0298 family)